MAERSGPSRRDALFGLAGVATGIGLAKAPLLAHTADADSPYLNPDNAIDWRHINQSTIDVDAIGMRAGGNASANARALTDAWYEGIIGKRPTPSPKLSDGLSDAIKGTALRFGAGEYRLGDFNALDTDGKRPVDIAGKVGI